MGKLLLSICFLLVSIFSFGQAKPKAPVKKAPVQTASKPAATTGTAKAGREISITLTPYRNCKVYLGCYYGPKTKVIADSAVLDANSHGVFKGDTKLTGGIYFVVSPNYSIQFELLMDNEQHFSIKADSAHKDEVVITGSKDNDLFKEYTKFSSVTGKKIYELEQQFAKAKNAKDSADLRAEIIKGRKEMQAYQNSIIEKYPESLLANLFTVMRRPEPPTKLPIVNGKADSTYPYWFVRNNFWNDVNFSDDRLLRTPFFEPKLDEYFKYYISPDADSIVPEIKTILLSARAGKEIYPFLLTKFTNKYVNPEYMGQDKVFLYLFKEFYLKGDTTLLNPASRKTIMEKGWSLYFNQLGEAAPPLALTDTLGKVKNMHDLNGKFTLVVFWDPHCGHCKETIPRVDSIYQAKWKALGMKVYSVYIYNDNVPDWKKFINEKKLFDWTHVYQTAEAKDAEIKSNVPGFRQLYDAHITPTIYLLDEKKNIIAKQISIEQFDEVIAARLKKEKSSTK